MKKATLIAALALAYIGAANADTILTATNRSGGNINLTNNTSRSCPKGYLAVYSTGRSVNDEISRGCWKIIDDNVHVLWDDGAEKMFPMDRFVFTDFGEKFMNTLSKKGNQL